jgi:5'(3')-deoxyribonucleotidase
MFKDAGIKATSREEALKNAEDAGNKLLVAAVNATNARTQPSYTQTSNESQEISETLKKVKGKWALVSRHKPEKVLQYYHGSGHPSKEWVSKVERRVHSFESQIVERRETFTDIMPDGDITYTWHREQRAEQRKIHFKDLIDMAQDAVKLYRDELAQQGDGSFVIKRKSDGLGIGVIKTQRPDGTYGYHVATTHYNFNARPGQKVYMVEAEEQHPKFKVYLDMDGVLADFFGEWARLDGKDHYKDIDNPQAKLELIRKHPTFWVNLPMLPHARELIRTVKELFGEYYICSKPLEGDPRSEPGKMAWIRDHLADMPPAGVILTHNKAQHANTGNGPNILIDDYGVNVNAWKMAGGIALKYEDTRTVSNIQHVKKVLANFAKTGVQL